MLIFHDQYEQQCRNSLFFQFQKLAKIHIVKDSDALYWRMLTIFAGHAFETYFNYLLQFQFALILYQIYQLVWESANLIQRELILMMENRDSLRISIEARYQGDIEYEQGDFLGKGSLGTVYKVKIDNDAYALKRIELGPRQRQNPKLIQALNLQISLMQKLKHRNIVQLYHVYKSEEVIQLIIEYLPGGNVYSKIKEYGRLPENLARKYMKDVVEGIQYLHSFPDPIIHRDIKPENLLIDEEGTVKLCDFGSAGLIKDNKQRLSFVGTNDYMAPEMKNSKGHSQSLDIWSLGILLYQFLTGKTPEIEQDSSLLIKFPNFISRPAEDLIKKLIVQNPHERLKLKQIKNHIWFCTQDYSAKIDRLSTFNSESIEDLKDRLKQKYGQRQRLAITQKKKISEVDEYPMYNSILSEKEEDYYKHLRQIQQYTIKCHIRVQNTQKIEQLNREVELRKQEIKQQIRIYCKHIKQANLELQKVKQENPLQQELEKLKFHLKKQEAYISSLQKEYKNKILQFNYQPPTKKAPNLAEFKQYKEKIEEKIKILQEHKHQLQAYKDMCRNTQSIRSQFMFKF